LIAKLVSVFRADEIVAIGLALTAEEFVSWLTSLSWTDAVMDGVLRLRHLIQVFRKQN